MLSSVRQLVESNHDKTIGNHKVEVNGSKRRYIYWSTAICVVDTDARTFVIDNGGYNTSSTNRAIGDYRRHFLSLGYTEVSKNA